MKFNEILNCYHYGSVVYKTNKPSSDIDYIAIVEKLEKEQFLSSYIDINFYSKENFDYQLNQCKIWALECYFLKDEHILKQSYPLSLKLDKDKLRRSIRDQTEKSYVKAKKKLTIEIGQEKIGLKSYWHSLRILMFGIQLSNYGKIINYQEANYLYDKILSYKDWYSLDSDFNSLYKSLTKEFRELTPIKK